MVRYPESTGRCSLFTFAVIFSFVAISPAWLLPQSQEQNHGSKISGLQLIINAADSLRAAGFFKESEDKYRKALKLNKKSLDALKGLGKIAYARQDWGKIKRWFKKVLEIDPENEEAIYHLTTSPNERIVPVVRRADSLRTAGKYEEAEEVYKKALKIYQGCFQAFRGLGKVYFEKQNWARVKDWYKQILDVQPRDLEAGYCLGIAYREAGKTDKHIIKKLHFGKSKKYFAGVIKIDSSFKDVLYQRGFLERRKEKWFESVRWGELQLLSKPDLVHVQVGLFKFYRLLLKNKGEREVTKMLRTAEGDWPAYFLGELHRLKKRYTEADAIFRSLLNQELTISKTPILLSLVRLNIQQNNEEQAIGYFNLATDSIKFEVDSEFLFEDLKYILKDKELDYFKTLSDVEDKRRFFHRFWDSRDPTPVSPINVRVLEHYRRLVYAEKNYWFDRVRNEVTDPDKFGVLKFPKSYELNEEFNDRGLIYIRYGEPDQTATTVSPSPRFNLASTSIVSSTLPRNESWLYEQSADQPKRIFHFMVDPMASGNNWRLSPVLANFSMLEDRQGWDPKLDRLLSVRSQSEYLAAAHEMEIENSEVVFKAMSNDSHSWSKKVMPLKMSAFVAHFRGDQGKTRMEVYIGIQLKELSLKKAQQEKSLEFEYGAGIYDSHLDEQAKFFEKHPLADIDPKRISNDYFINRYVFDLKPETYQLSFYAQSSDKSKLGGGNFDIEVPSFKNDKLNLSDLELAFNIVPFDSSSVFNRGELSIVPNPSAKFKKSEPMFLYYEIYNLTKDEQGVTSFETEYSINQIERQKKGLKRIFGFLGGGGKESVSIKNDRQGHDETSFEYASFDVSKLDSGDYRLTVKVNDLNGDLDSEKTVKLRLE